MKPPSALRRLILARRYAIEEWVNPALLELCERPEPLSLDEARQMDFEDVVLLGSVRQNVRSLTLTTNEAGIRDCIQAWRSGEPWSPGPTAVSRPPTPGTPTSSASRPSTPGIPVASQPPEPVNRLSGTQGAFGIFGKTRPSSSGMGWGAAFAAPVPSTSQALQGGSAVSSQDIISSTRAKKGKKK